MNSICEKSFCVKLTIEPAPKPRTTVKSDTRPMFAVPKIGQKSARNLSTRKGHANLSRRTRLGRKTSALSISPCDLVSTKFWGRNLFARWHSSPRSDSLSFTALPFRSLHPKINRKLFPQKANRMKDSVNGSTSRISTTALLPWRLKRKILTSDEKENVFNVAR